MWPFKKKPAMPKANLLVSMHGGDPVYLFALDHARIEDLSTAGYKNIEAIEFSECTITVRMYPKNRTVGGMLGRSDIHFIELNRSMRELVAQHIAGRGHKWMLVSDYLLPTYRARYDKETPMHIQATDSTDYHMPRPPRPAKPIEKAYL